SARWNDLKECCAAPNNLRNDVGNSILADDLGDEWINFRSIQITKNDIESEHHRDFSDRILQSSAVEIMQPINFGRYKYYWCGKALDGNIRAHHVTLA